MAVCLMSTSWMTMNPISRSYSLWMGSIRTNLGFN
jgi:hypothetical protein